MADRYARLPDAFPVLRAGDLLLREPEGSDAEAWYTRNSDPEVVYPMGGDPMESVAEAREVIGTIREAFRAKTMIRWAIVLEPGGPAVGTTGFNAFHARDRRAELGYGLARGAWGHGVMTAATRACIDYAFRELELNRIDAEVVAGNERSLRVLEKLGFSPEGYLRQYKVIDGAIRDFWVLGLLREDWE